MKVIQQHHVNVIAFPTFILRMINIRKIFFNFHSKLHDSATPLTCNRFKTKNPPPNQRIIDMKGLIILFVIISIQPFNCIAKSNPRVFIFSDINIDSGDPDDRQSLIHLLWYANELKIEGFVPERWNANGLEAGKMAIEAYSKDYEKYSFNKSGYPLPSALGNIIAKDQDDAIRLLSTATSDTRSPLYVLIWGNLELFTSILFRKPEIAKNIRLITIATDLMLENDIKHIPSDWKKSAPCKQLNWNGFGRVDLYSDSRFFEMWWLEINWTYNGMFIGEEPKQMFDKLSIFGELGRHLKEVVKNEPWASYFRVGDTPSVLYLIDPANKLDDPTQSSWAGKFNRPFPEKRPFYFTDSNGPNEWDYENPCNTWNNHVNVKEYASKTLEVRRNEMYNALLSKLNHLYDTN